jgi:hypothetical protein
VNGPRKIATTSSFLVFLCLLALSGCGAGEQGEKPIGEGFAGATNPALRDRLGAGSTIVGTLKPGEHVVILQKRRRWVRVRTASKREGWTDEGSILAPGEFAKFQQAVAKAAERISQGLARARNTVNLRLEPDRKSPAFFQLSEGETCDLLEHRALPRPLPAGAAPPAPGAEAATPLQRAEPQPPAAARKAAKGKKGEAKTQRRLKPGGPEMEDWYLLRGKGKAGWALARMIEMAISDEVAQYAEGKPITAWQVLNEVEADGQKKPQYVWGTSDDSGLPYDFTGIRVFIWDARHHRYQTSYLERNIRGVYPLTVGRVRLRRGEVPSFTVTTLDQAGNRVTREFVLLGNIVRRREQVQ